MTSGVRNSSVNQIWSNPESFFCNKPFFRHLCKQVACHLLIKTYYAGKENGKA